MSQTTTKKPVAPKSRKALVLKSGIKAGLIGLNHNTAPRAPKALVLKSGIKAGLIGLNHNTALARA